MISVAPVRAHNKTTSSGSAPVMRYAPLAVACLALACSDSSGPSIPEIAGDWRADAVVLDGESVTLALQFTRPLQGGSSFMGTGHLITAANDSTNVGVNGTRVGTDVTFGLAKSGPVVYSFDGAFVGDNTIEGTFTKSGMAPAAATLRRP